MKTDLYEKILGCLGMVAIGDALGMPSHDMTTDQIRARFGGPLRTFRPPLDDTRVHRGMKAGQITDDTILTLAVAGAYMDGNGAVTSAGIASCTSKAYKKWAGLGLSTMFGPSTRRAVELFDSGRDPVQAGLEEKHPMTGASNGGAMKIAPVGLVHPGDLDGTVEDVLTVCLPSHGTQTAISAAAAIACGISEAMRPGSDVLSVAKAALGGARRGEALGKKKARTVPLPSVPDRIQWALHLAMDAGNDEEAMALFSRHIGSGLASYESIPTAVGIFLACDGDPLRCAVAGANVGYDTDTIASMAGALSGALRGFGGIPRDLYAQVVEINGLDLESVSRGLETLADQTIPRE